MKCILGAYCKMAVILTLTQCALEDNKRCLDELVFDPELGVCLPVDTDEDDPIDTATDDGTDTDTSMPSGLGELCENSDQCAGYEADFCLVDPDSGVGFCTVQDCTPGSCPTGYLCCDCSAIFYPIFCMPLEGVEAMEQYCECEEG